MAGTDSKHQADDATMPPQRRSRWWIAVLTFVIGVVVGVLIVGFLFRSTPDPSAVQSPSPMTPSPTGGQSAPAAQRVANRRRPPGRARRDGLHPEPDDGHLRAPAGCGWPS